MEKRNSKQVSVGRAKIGGSAPITVQSMTNVPSSDLEAVRSQILALKDAGCDIVRMTVPDRESVATIYKLKSDGVDIPLVADIHFDYRLAVEAAEAGVDKIRINPGNIGDESRVKEAVAACKKRNIPIRIGVNSGSLEKHILSKYGAPTPEALAESALYHASLLEKFDFYDIVISVKSSDVKTMIEANRLLAEKCAYPLHLGVTEAGSAAAGTVKSAVGIGALLSEGIGDTIRVSLTDDPVKEVKAGRDILCALGLYNGGYYDVVSCPTCGRTKIDLIKISGDVEKALALLPAPKRKITVAVMGCIVNGPGEAANADIGIAGGVGEAVLFKKDKIIKKISEERIADELIKTIKELDG
ncbi:MAG: flavodoxin-dependent (E)-4-hydroxy-3-methylbut-2-enyl-diphosphate synthase [Clostridia bacterium]|nr:flavodoxin-dependent (E)-4-hydroxy-3-methylbut-2-enyl-diphosphate synthase [Clostridia bacterium]MBO4429031.1 flavodoxin-dependent (E)-4-hydroxy-3-methylbut-2-enyl-diphosphate synthase [Clostridia bacterium]